MTSSVKSWPVNSKTTCETGSIVVVGIENGLDDVACLDENTRGLVVRRVEELEPFSGESAVGPVDYGDGVAFRSFVVGPRGEYADKGHERESESEVEIVWIPVVGRRSGGGGGGWVEEWL
ncbi:RING/FYVE/PHD zinc finger superfamily protein [Striga asiatica]|uniref:RING/FYVE/PHD zinc finger superfamily protein n=1 Tax=Striga asiatica TaxID=4170 RepID=A0A5A7R7J1_STRAF|nr:RING/FYVE/PHD zinc finger superfamily protein [Striga asiatica]